MASMINPRLDFCAHYYNGHIYVFGGKNQYGPMRSCEKYDIAQNKWSNLPNLPEPTSNMASCLSEEDQLVILSGGYTKYEASRKVCQFDFEKQKFIQMPRMMFHRAEHIMDIVEINGEKSLVSLGGSDHPYNGRVVWNIEVYNNGVWQLYDRIHPTGPFTKGNLKVNK